MKYTRISISLLILILAFSILPLAKDSLFLSNGVITIVSNENGASNPHVVVNDGSITLNDKVYPILEVEGGNLSGVRQANVAVDIGYGDREYWGFTNTYGQLVYVYAAKIRLQDDRKEQVLPTGRYYSDEARVPGTERSDLDQGHVIADSLGGVSNAYNITPQDSILNRHGDQAYMEKVIRDANGCRDFYAIITYASSDTQIPTHYHIEYKLNKRQIVEEFDNIDPEVANLKLEETQSLNQLFDESETVAKIDTNHNGIISTKEAKAAGYKMPIKSTFWLYRYMIDGDGDGFVGE